MACSSPPEVNFVAAPQARSVMTREWVFLWSCHDASRFAVVVLWVVSNADPLGKKARVVWEVKCAGEETALS